MFVSVCGAMKQKAGGHPLNRFNKHKTALFINWITLKVHMLTAGIKKITKLQNMYGRLPFKPQEALISRAVASIFLIIPALYSTFHPEGTQIVLYTLQTQCSNYFP